MKKVFFLLLLFAAFQSRAQLSVPQRMYHLCKVWGYLKYHHPDHCSIQWNNLLLGRVDSVAAASGDAAFQSILYNLCLQTGVPALPALPIPADSAKNYQTGWFSDPALSASVSAFLSNVEAHHRPDASGCMVLFNTYTDPSYNSLIDFRRDSILTVPNFSYTNLRHRMLVYFYYWNTIKYFAPQIDLADAPWDSTLARFMPDMMAASTDSAFALTLSRVVSRLDDSHGFYSSVDYYKVTNNVNYLQQQFRMVPLKIIRIDQQHVIKASGNPSIQPGDVITKIDGMDADTFFNRQMQYYAASNGATKYRIMYQNVLYGPGGGTRTFELKDASNTTRQVSLTFNLSGVDYQTWYTAQVDTLPLWTVSPCGYGYINMGKLQQADVDMVYTSLQYQPAIVFDVRNYPHNTIWNLKPLLFTNPNVSARYLMPYLPYPGYYNIGNDEANFGSWHNVDAYNGKVIILVNEETQSHAEYTAQILRTHPKAVIIGSQTAGADGNVSQLILPGGIRASWTSIGWYEANWHNPQRAGLQIDTLVTPTLAGIRAGKDELLARAMSCPLSVAQRQAEDPDFLLYTAGQQLHVQPRSGYDYWIVLADATGRTLLKLKGGPQGASIPTAGYARGIYVVTIVGREGLLKRERVVF